MGKKARLKKDPARKLRKNLRNTPPTYIDLVQYVQIRTRCSRGTVIKVLMAGALMVDSHPVGYKWERDRKILDPFLDSKHRDKIVIRKPPKNA